MGQIVRPATFSDQSAVAHLLTGIGWPSRSQAGWEWLYKANPNRKGVPEQAPIGWVIEEDENILGYLANIHLDYSMAGKDIKAATCSNFYVQDEARSLGFKIIREFFLQKNVELLMSTTANKASAPMYKMFKAATPTDQSFQKAFFWLADSNQLIKDVCRTTKYIPSQLSICSPLLAPMLNVANKFLGHGMLDAKTFDGEVRTVEVSDIDKSFDKFWERLRTNSGLMVKRNAENLRWYLSDPDGISKPSLFAAYDKEGLAGFLIGSRHQPKYNEVARYKIIDLVTRDQATSVAAALMSFACKQAAKENTGLVFVSRMGQPLCNMLEQLGPRTMTLKDDAHFIRASNPDLIADVIEPNGWQATGMDGDGLFSLHDRAGQERAGKL